MKSTNQPTKTATVAFMCVQCGTGPLLFAHVVTDGPVVLLEPGERVGIRNRLNDGSYIDQRSQGIPVDRYGPEREPNIGKKGGVVMRCGRCGSRRPYPPIRSERIMDEARRAARTGVDRVVVAGRGDLIPEPRSRTTAARLTLG
jgi:hypothetical protein